VVVRSRSCEFEVSQPIVPGHSITWLASFVFSVCFARVSPQFSSAFREDSNNSGMLQTRIVRAFEAEAFPAVIRPDPAIHVDLLSLTHESQLLHCV